MSLERRLMSLERRRFTDTIKPASDSAGLWIGSGLIDWITSL